MASTVSTELPPLQSREVDFVGSRPSPGRRSSVGDDEDNQSEGTISEVDPTEGDVASSQTSRSQGGSEEFSATAPSRGGRAVGVQSQYHSISQLSSPSVATSTAATAPAAPQPPAASAFCIQPSSSPYDFSQQLYGRSVADSVYVLRGVFHGPSGQRDQPGGSGRVGDAANGSEAIDDIDDDDDEWTTDRPEMMHDRMSYDDDEFCGSPRHSANVSTSSVDELSGDEEARGPNDLYAKPNPDTDRGVGGNGMPLSSASDSGSAGDDVIEAKRARMESIVTNMRPSLQPSSSDRTTNGIGSSLGGREDDPKRRPKRKQYIPKQHDVSSEMESLGKQQQQQLDSGEETPTIKDRKSSLPIADKMELEAELRAINEQLNCIRHKYAHLFDDAQQITAAEYYASKNASDFDDGRPGYCRRENSWSQAFHDAFSKHASEWKKFVATQDVAGLPAHPAPKQQSERYGTGMQSDPIAGDTPIDVQRLAETLKAEIAERVESLVNEIIRNFVAKYGLTAAADCSSLDTAAESKFKPEPREKSPEVAVRSADTVTSGSAAYAEDLSPGRVVDDADRRPRMVSTPAASFLSVPSLLLPNPRHPTTTPTAEESAPIGRSSSLVDNDASVNESFDRKSHSSSDVPLSAPDQTAFEIPSRTAHHPLYSLFAPHAYYPNASRMAAAAAAAAAVAANGGSYPPVPPVASSMLFPHYREPEQTEALPLVVSAPTKRKRTKVTDTRLSPRAARSILHDGSGGGHRHHHAGSYHGHPHHHQHARPDSSNHRPHHSSGAPRVTDDAQDSATDRRRSSPTRSSADNALVSPFLQSRHPALPLLPASLPTSVAVPNPSLQHSNIMSAIFQFSQQRIQQQQQQVDSTEQRFAPHPTSAFVDKFDFKLLGSDIQMSAGDGRHGSLPSARKAAENDTDGYEPIFHEDGLVSFPLSLTETLPRCFRRK